MEVQKKPVDVDASGPAREIYHNHNITKEQIVSMLESLLMCCGEDVLSLKPQYLTNGELGTVAVTFLGGCCKTANVHMDSHLAICRDVLNQVFE